VIPEIDIETFAARREAGDPVLDVREPDEYAHGHVAGAVLIPLGQLAARIDEVPAGRVLVICHLGGRSMQAAQMLAPKGHDVTNVAGGTTAWIESGREVVQGMERG
jgi:rhodanese-related sulfurtransferase